MVKRLACQTSTDSNEQKLLGRAEELAVAGVMGMKLVSGEKNLKASMFCLVSSGTVLAQGRTHEALGMKPRAPVFPACSQSFEHLPDP